MGDSVPISMGRGSNKARFGQGGATQFVNAYVEDMGEAGKTSFSAYAINGWNAFASLPNGNGVRRMLGVDDVLLAVANRLLFSTNAFGTAVTTIGGIPSDGFVTMAHNRKTPNKQVAIVCDGLWFIYEGGTLTQGSDTDLPPPIFVVESDGYFFFLIQDGRWFLAGPNEGLSIDPLDFAEAEASSDKNVAAAVRGRTFIPFGEKSAEFWDPNGDPIFPYSRTTAIDVGCYAAGTVANLLVTKGGTARDMVIFAGTNKEGAYAGIMALDGYQPTVISSPEVDRLVRDEPNKAALRCLAWTEDAHSYYTLSGTSFSTTWDGKTGEWHDRRSISSPRWNAGCVVQFGGMTLFGHQTSNTIANSLPDVFDENGSPIVWQIQPPPIHMYPKWFKVNTVYVDMITGVGLNSGNDDDDQPELVFDYSKDGGVSWAVARRIPLGGMNERYRRVKIRSLGRFDHNGVTLRFRCSAKVVKGLQQLAIDATPLKG
jgi:hypothetical protein